MIPVFIPFLNCSPILIVLPALEIRTLLLQGVRMVCSFFFLISFYSNLRSLVFSGNKCDRIDDDDEIAYFAVR